MFAQPFWDVDFETLNLLWNADQSDDEWELDCLNETSFDVRRLSRPQNIPRKSSFVE